MVAAMTTTTDSQSNLEQTGITMRSDQLGWLRKKAAEDERSVSWMLRKLVDQAIAEENQSTETVA